MYNSEQNDITSVLNLIDFERAFDTISLTFIPEALDFFSY